MPQQDKNAGNKNAALPTGQRGKVNFTVSLSRKRLNKFILYMNATSGNSEPTDGQISELARQKFYEWIDQLPI